MTAKPTIKEIAAACGTSITTVSLVLNQKPHKISAALQARILAEAQRQGYTTQKARRIGKRPGIGLIVPEIENQFFAGLTGGVDRAATREGYRMMLGISNNDHAQEAAVLSELLSADIQALLIVTCVASPINVYSAMFAELKIPVILVDRVYAALPCSSLTYNHHKGSYYAARHLLELGHRKIACLSGEGAYSFSVSKRVKGFVQAMEEAGLTVDEKDIFPGNYKEDSGYALADDILAAGYTAVLSCNDLMACGLYKRFYERGLAIPDDLSVIGYDDLFFSRLMQPPLSTVGQDPSRLGEESVRRAIMEVNHPGCGHQDIYFEPELIVRNSTKKRQE